MSANAQGSPQMSWLDGEIRKQKAIITELRDQLDKKTVEMADQGQRILSLEDRLSKLQAQLLRIPAVEEGTQRTRDELVLKMAEMRQEQQKRETEFLRNRQTERERDVLAVQTIEAELKRIDSLDNAMAARQAEDQRLNEVQLRMQQDIDAAATRLLRNEEASRQIADGVDHSSVKLGQVQLAVQEIAKERQGEAGRLLLIEEALSKYSQRVAGLEDMRTEITKRQDELLETQRRSDVDRAQLLTEWGRRLEEFGHQLEIWREQLRYFGDQHDKTRRVLRDMQELAQQVSQQQDQLRQTQRISEEQLRRELREWRSEDDRRWAQTTAAQSKLTEEQAKRDQGQDGRLDDLETRRVADDQALAVVRDALGQAQAGLVGELRTVREVFLRFARAESESLDRAVAELAAAWKKEED